MEINLDTEERNVKKPKNENEVNEKNVNNKKWKKWSDKKNICGWHGKKIVV